ncbi:retrovirus-related pol polyprotein from transposon TNT 1-94 [Tanacetum coccineum]
MKKAVGLNQMKRLKRRYKIRMQNEVEKCVFNSNHDACVSRYLKDVNARTKKPNVVPISASKPKRKANKSVATPHKKTVASDTTIQKSKSYYKKLYENTNQEWKWWIAKRCPSVYTWTQKPLRTKKIWMPKIRKDDESTSISPTIDIVSRITNIVQLILFIVDSGCTKHMTGNLKLLCNFVEKFLVQASVINVKWRLLKITLQAPFLNVQMMSDHNSSDLAPQRQEMSVENVASGLVPQGQKASDYDNSDPVPPRQNVVPSAEKTDSSQQGLEFLFSPLLEEYYNPTHGLAEENNNDQAPNASFQEAEFINPFCTRVQEIGESSSRNIDNTDVQTRRQLATDPEMCMFALTVSTAEPKNIKEAMADSAWIEAMQDELHQFDRLKVWELVDKPFGKMIIKLKWLWKNKKDEDQTVIRNKARLVAKGYAQEEEGRGLRPRREGFVDPDHPEKVYLLRKALYGLKQAPRACHKVVRLGINPMIQPEPEDLPKDNPKLEIAVLRIKKKCMDKGSKERSPPHNLRQKPGQYICCQNHKLIADIENDIMDPVMQCTTLPSHSSFSQQKLVSFVTEIHTLSIDISFRDR